jgi:6-pyruvoyltetrahydropterin/6-carboxytetrahydropterin synthase
MPESPKLPTGPVLVTRLVHFNAAHRLHNPAQSDAWNTDTFGPCNNPQWHGHNYDLEVSVVGDPEPETGYVIDLKELKDILEEKILGPCDHKNLNEQVPFLRGINPPRKTWPRPFGATRRRHRHGPPPPLRHQALGNPAQHGGIPRPEWVLIARVPI